MAIGRRLGAIARLPARLSAFFDRSVGGLDGDRGRAAGTVQIFAALGILGTVAFSIRYVLIDGVTVAPLLWLNAASLALFAAAIMLVARGHGLAAAILYLAVAIAGMVYMVELFGWRTGHHLYLITSAQLVFLVFTDRHRWWRWLFSGLSLGTFLYLQLAAPAIGPYSTPDTAVLSTTFAVNAVGTATLMFVLSLVAHHRAGVAQIEAARHAARAEYLANTDPLTGLANRRPITARLEELAGPTGSPYSVAIADLDRFKQLNDVYGHACGDRVLASLGGRLRGQLRATDALGRWGGEEFIFVFAGTSLTDARAMMERMREIVGGSPVACGDHVHSITMSVGVADGTPDGSSHRVVKRGDDALYDAKLAGRDRVRVRRADDADPALPSRDRRIG